MKSPNTALLETFLCLLGALLLLAPPVSLRARQLDSALFAGMRWRSLGPFRGGRVLAVAGIPAEPDVFYFGSADGGVWKTDNAGLTWDPLFQHEPVASIGAIAVAPSDPRVIYVGTGESDMRSDISLGNGVYKSTDAGRSWSHLGLSDTRHVARILVDPRNPDLVLVAAFGHAYDANSDRGVFRSTDGGRTWRKVLYKNDLTGAIDLAFAQNDPQVVYAALWQARRTTWSQYPPLGGPGGGIYKSTDEGLTWSPVSGHGLPSGPWGRIGLATSGRNRVYALIDCDQGGLYRSDDAGRSWLRASGDPRIWSRGWYFSRVTADPRNPSVVWIPNVALYRSTDAGRHFLAVKGAPGGDDYHILWIDPQNTGHMILGTDQGAVVSLDAGRTWSSWYNQPTAQIYHVSTDHRLPYWIYAAQQDSGTVGIASRSDYGALTFRDWHPIGGGESGYMAPDPADPDVVYGGDTYGTLHKWDARTSQSQTISPALLVPFGSDIALLHFRFTWTSPLLFSPQDPRLLLYGSQYLLESTDGGSSWTAASPDLTLRPGTRGQPQRGVIYTIAPSPLRAGEIWVGTDNGLVQLTLDGARTWKNVTPPGLSDWSKFSIIEASHFDPATAYAAVDRHRLGDLKPYVYITRDFGATWSLSTRGIPSTAYVHAVREDPVRRGLLFAGTETGISVSFDDGADWQSLQLNLPTTAVRDLAVEQGDLIAATHGRGIWVLDDISPLRQATAKVASSSFYLFRPRQAYRFRLSTNTDTPLPPEIPQGENPPAGAVFDYWLAAIPTGPVTLEIFDADGKLVRHFSSADTPQPPDMSQYPVAPYWVKPVDRLLVRPGMHRFVWDLRYPAPKAVTSDFPIAAIPGQTSLEPAGPYAAPGRYTVRLTVGGQSQARPFDLLADPRVKATGADLQAQLFLARRIVSEMDSSYDALTEARALRARLESARRSQSPPPKAALALEPKLAALAGKTGSLSKLNDDLGTLLAAVESADVAPTINALETWSQVDASFKRLMDSWRQIRAAATPASQ